MKRIKARGQPGSRIPCAVAWRPVFTGSLVLLAALGVLSGQAQAGGYMSQVWGKEAPDGCSYGIRPAQGIPGMVGPWGQPVQPVYPYSMEAPGGESAARAMLTQS